MKKHNVRVGQVWRDNDPRFQHKPRLITVNRVTDYEAECTSKVTSKGFLVSTRTVKIRLDRFKANNNGYILLTDS